MTSGTMAKLRHRLLGVAFLAVLAGLGWLSLAAYGKQFTPVATVTLYTDSAGNEMHPGAQVLARGVQVGEVRAITASGHGARLELAIAPGMLSHLPASVSAQLLPTTLFGERYVDLVIPRRPAAGLLASGGVIRQDRSRDAIELERVLNDLMPMLTAVRPQQLSVTLTAVAQALQGRGAELGRTLRQVNGYLRRLSPQLPALDADIRELVTVTRAYRQAAPSVVQALTDFTTTSRTIAAERGSLTLLYRSVTGAAGTLTTFLNGNSANLIRLAADSEGTLRILATYSAEFPCTLHDLVAFEPAIDRALGKNTSEPGLHVTLHVVPSLGRYLPGRNTPGYGDDTGPHCYPVPFGGVALSDGGGTAGPAATASTRPGPVPAATASVTGPGGLGLPNSPQESELIGELLAAQLRTSPAALPDWASVLAGPLYRGTQVRLG